MTKKTEVQDSDNLIIETMEDGTEYTIDLEVCNTVADEIMNSLFALDESGEVENFDAVATCFSLFISTYHVLLQTGWTIDNLKQELDEHFECHRNGMN